MTYDLRRLRLHGLIERAPRSHRYRITPTGAQVAMFYARLYTRALRPASSLQPSGSSAPFSPEATVKEFADAFKGYRITEVTSDRYAGSWPTEAFRKVGITVTPSERTRSDIYRAALPMVMSGQVELLDHARLLKQLASLERRKGRQGKDSVDAPPRQHEDVANSACGALVLTALQREPAVVQIVRLAGFGAPLPGTSSVPLDQTRRADAARDYWREHGEHQSHKPRR